MRITCNVAEISCNILYMSYTHTCTRTPAHAHLHTHTCTRTPAHAHLHTLTPAHSHLHTHTCTGGCPVRSGRSQTAPGMPVVPTAQPEAPLVLWAPRHAIVSRPPHTLCLYAAGESHLLLLLFVVVCSM